MSNLGGRYARALNLEGMAMSVHILRYGWSERMSSIASAVRLAEAS